MKMAEPVVIDFSGVGDGPEDEAVGIEGTAESTASERTLRDQCIDKALDLADHAEQWLGDDDEFVERARTWAAIAQVYATLALADDKAPSG